MRHRMVTEVARDQADLQLALRVAVVRVRLPRGAQWRFVALAEAEMIGHHGGRVVGMHVRQAEQHVAVDLIVLRIPGQSRAARLDGVVGAPHLAVGRADVQMGADEVVLDFQRARIAGQRFLVTLQ
ncbi:hypothetical protein D3C72_1413100 [compost metagenome]